jgi:phenylalanyl-tRNA synthetase beta chain
VVKGIIDQLFNPLGIRFTYQATDRTESYHPYKQADIFYKEQLIGQIAELHPSTLKKADIFPTVIVEINLKSLLEEESPVNYQPVSKFPNVSRDLAVVIDENVSAAELLSMIEQTVRKQLVSIDIFDVYQGANIETGKKSMAFSLVFNDKDKTLSTEEVDQLMKKITNRLAFSFKATVRS